MSTERTPAGGFANPNDSDRGPGGWRIFQGNHAPHDGILDLPAAPRWRRFVRDDDLVEPTASDLRPLDEGSRDARRGKAYRPAEPTASKPALYSSEIDLVNAALYLRRPLLVTGKPGSGKSSLAYAIAYELKLGPVLHWPVTSRTSLSQGLYRYDPVARLGDVRANPTAAEAVGRYITLGPLGTAFAPASVPRVLLVDEIDKSDIDLPNDLLHLFEEGWFEIPELKGLPGMDRTEVALHRGYGTTEVRHGRVECREFPLVVMTSNGEREFPPAFLRRCLRLELPEAGAKQLAEIVESHFAEETPPAEEMDLRMELIRRFLALRDDPQKDLATDQLLNCVYLLTRGLGPTGPNREALLAALLRPMSETDSK